jgi:hypothetical protein
MMVQSAENWHRQNAPDGLNGARYRRLFVQSEMCPSALIILHIGKEHMAQMPLAKHDEMIKAFASDRADEPFRMSILPWRSSRSRSVTNSHRTKTPFEYLAIDAVASSLPAITFDVGRAA